MTSMALPPPPPFAAIPYPSHSSGGTSMRVVRRKIRKLGGDEPGEPAHVDVAPPHPSDEAPTAPWLPRVNVAIDEPRPATKGSPLVVAVYRTPVPPVAKAVTVDLIKPTPIPSPPLPRVEAIVGEDFAVPAVEELTAQSVDPPPPPVSAKRSLPPGVDPVGVREVPPRRPASIPPMSVKPVALPSPLPPPSTAVVDDSARDSTPMISYGDPASLPPAAEDDGVEVAVDDTAEVEVERLSSPDDLSAEARALEAARAASVPPPPPLPEAARGAVKTGAARSMAVTVVEARRKRRYWWEELFSEDYFRTLPRLEREQVRAEVDWIEHALGTESGAAILDLACGAGHHAAELALRRYDVTGLDLSPAMLGRATESAAAQGAAVKWAQADMTQMEFEDAFDAAYCVGTSFGLFDDERNAEVARRLHRALKPHGTFLLQVLNRDHVIQRQPAMAWFEGEGCVCMEETSFNFITSRLNVKRTMIFDDGRQREIEYSVRLYSLNELGQVLHQAGFRILEVSGHPRTPGAFFGASSRELIILAQKRGAEVVEIPQDASPKLSPTEA
jgi:SAM-dependent methyltransferase